MKKISHSYQTLYSELAQRSLDASFTSSFDERGRFVKAAVKGRRYWYFDLPDDAGGKKRTYVGPADDPEIARRVENFKDLKADVRERRKLVSTLIREAYLPGPERETGTIIAALEKAGFFRLRGVLVGTAAFQCYSAILGVRLPNTAMVTADADFAKFHSISIAVEDETKPILDVLRDVDETFREIPHQTDGRHCTRYASRSGYKVEFLTPNRGSDDNQGRPTKMPSLGRTSAEPLRFLDYLIYQPVRAVVLHGSGIPVSVPAPERYAVHKLIVSSRRRDDNDGMAKSRKDLLQAQTLMQALIELRQEEDLADAYMEAYNRGSAWQEAISLRLSKIDDREEILTGIAKGIERLGEAAEDYGIRGEDLSSAPSP